VRALPADISSWRNSEILGPFAEIACEQTRVVGGEWRRADKGRRRRRDARRIIELVRDETRFYAACRFMGAVTPGMRPFWRQDRKAILPVMVMDSGSRYGKRAPE